MAQEATPVRTDRHDGWVEVAIDRPERRNALDGPTLDGLLEAVGPLRGDAGVRAVVLAGAGGAFCSGLDLKAFGATPPPPWVAGFPAKLRALHVALASLDAVLLVALERFAINGGAALALAADLAVCGEGAFLQVAEVRLGMPAPNNLAWLRMRHPEAVAARLALTGDRVGAHELLRLGVVAEVVPDDRVLARCRERAAEIAGWPPAGVAAIKSAMRAATLGTTPEAWFASFAAPAGLERLRT